MSRRVNYRLSEGQLAEVEQAINHAPLPKVRQRGIAIRLLHLGYPVGTVAELLAVTGSSINNWHRRYRAAGIAGLAHRAKSGRPGKARGEYLQALDEAIKQSPRALGYSFSIWTINKLRVYLGQQTSILLS